MADALVSVATELILNRMLSIAGNEITVALGSKKELRSLCKNLDMVRAFLRDAEGKKGTDVVKVWLEQLKDVVAEADDLLDEVEYERLRRQARDRMRRKVTLCLPSLKRFPVNRKIGHKIEKINEELSRISKTASDLKLEKQNEQPDQVPVIDDHRQTDSYLDGFKVIGREDDEQRIIELLTQPRLVEKFTIVPIVGMGGIGKTTLAKSVYNNPEIKQHFGVTAWSCVSVKVTITALLTMILESLTKEKCKVQPNKERLITELRKELGNKRYLLVLDDVWDKEMEHWEDFRDCMQRINSLDGSGILITARSHEIGNNAKTGDLCALQVLSKDQCWSIFKERARPSPELEEVGREIVEKCYGLPLLVKVIGSTLRRSNNDTQVWSSIRDSMVHNQSTEERNTVLRTLQLSFDNLPNANVKQCFAYCSIFEKDKHMERLELVQQWIALGLVDETRGKEMEDVGNDIFQILVDNCLFQDVETNHENDFKVYCKMHDLVHDHVSELSKNVHLREVVSTYDHVQIPSSVKHLSLDHTKEADCTSEGFKKAMIDTTLWTLSLSGMIENNIPFECCRCLRILKLKGYSVKKLTDSIGDLVHLRYLDLSHTGIEVLPKSIGKLYHLQTLKMFGCGNPLAFPKEMRNLIRLRYFECVVGLTTIVGVLTSFPSLRTLPIFVVGQAKGSNIEALGPLKHLSGRISIRNLEKVGSKEEAAKAELIGKKKLYKIKLKWSNNEGDNRNDKDVLEGLQPPANVKILKIKNYAGDGFPTWVTKMAINNQVALTPLHNLVDITLSDCSKCSELPTLGGLPSLRTLELSDMNNLKYLSSSLSHRDDVTGSWTPLSPSLISLRLWHMDGLEKWINGEPNCSSTMLSPVLESLTIFECPNITLIDESYDHPLISLTIAHCNNLKSIKSFQGLTSLETLHINRCPRLLEIPDLHKQSHSLKTLQIHYCDNHTSFADKLDRLAFVKEMELGPFSEELCSFPSLGCMDKLGNHLHKLTLYGGDYYDSLPEEIKDLTALSTLLIWGFGMKELPIWLTNMSSIRNVCFYECPGLDEKTVETGAPREAKLVMLNGKVLLHIS